MLDWEEWKPLIATHAVTRTRAVPTAWEGLVLGNADMGAVVFGPAHKLCFRLTKMDLWDARMDGEHYMSPRPLSKFKAFIFEESRKLEPGGCVAGDLNSSWDPPERLFPCMRTAADVLVRVAQYAGFPLSMTQQLQMEDGLLVAEYPVGWWHERPKIRLRAFVSWQHNVLALKLELPPEGQQHAIVSLFRDAYGGRSWEVLSGGGPMEEKNGMPNSLRDPRVDALPPSELTMEGSSATLSQTIPGDAHCPERGFAVAAVCAEGIPFIMEPSGQAVLEAFGRDTATVFVSVASEMEGPDPMGRAKRLAEEAAVQGWESLYAEHAASWKQFWMRSAVQLEDEALQSMWIRSSYTLAITARSGKPAPGLYGVSPPYDAPPWRGDRHNNYPEYASLFWGAFATNHEEQAKNYTEFVQGYLPTARRIAREVYECAEGAVYPHCYIDGTDLYWFHENWARSLFLTAQHAQNCWWHYQYFGDPTFLREHAYPVIRECAMFYHELLKKNPPGDYTFWPTIATEIRGWTKDFVLNKNCIEDLSHIKFLMHAAVEASTILDTDEERRTAWQAILDHLPAYPTLIVDGKEEFVDFAGQDARPSYNHSVPLAPLWPAEDPDVVSDRRLRPIAERTLDVHPWDRTRLLIGRMRLGQNERVYEAMLGQKPDRDFASSFPDMAHTLLVSEMLVTRWDRILRLFPCWPLERRARFRDLRVKGAFLVSASCAEGRVEQASFLSERGEVLRLAPPWPGTVVRDEDSGELVWTESEDGVMQVVTKPGARYVLECQGR
ncbi:MAG: hypothetical protein V1800_08295 [Candidatus Latescibacterota bacterium]